MAQKIYEGIGGTARNIKDLYVGIGGTARKVKKAYIGVNGIARQFWDTESKLIWHPLSIQLSKQIGDLCYGNGRFVGLEYMGQTTSISTNGFNWSGGVLPSNDGWQRIAYGNGKFVAVGDTKIAYSSNGQTWSEINNPYQANGIFLVAYGRGKFVILPSFFANSDTRKPLYSTDGIIWNSGAFLNLLPEAPCWIDNVIYGNNEFRATLHHADDSKIKGTFFLISSDGIQWRTSYILSSSSNTYNPPENVYGIAYGDQKYIMTPGTYGNIIYQYKNNSVSSLNSKTLSSSAKQVIYGNKKFIAVDSNGNSIYINNNDTIKDGTTLPYGGDFSLAYGSNIFLAINLNGQISYAYDWDE